MWYQSWQAGYDDILKRGFPPPADERTILAELRSPHVGNILHGGSGDVPFLVDVRTREIFERSGLTGFVFGAVVVAKIATKGARSRKVTTGEPEDSIVKSRGVTLDDAPILHAVRITSAVEVLPDYESGKTPSGCVSPFRLRPGISTPDLWLPSYRGRVFSAWWFCSERFQFACESSELTDFGFEAFDTHMECYRERLRKDGRG